MGRDRGERLIGRRVKVLVPPDEIGASSLSLDAAIARLNNLTPPEKAATAKRVLDAVAEPLPNPEGKTLADMIMGKWPGDETDEEIRDALRKLS